jgi:hypothetical protein
MTHDIQGLNFLNQIFNLAATYEKPLIIVENPKYVYTQLLIKEGKAHTMSSQEWDKHYGERVLITIGDAYVDIAGFYASDLMEAYVTLKVKLQLEKELQSGKNSKQSDNVADSPR